MSETPTRSPFPSISLDAWRRAAADVAGGPSTLDGLWTVTADGMRIAPLYTEEDARPSGMPGLPPYTRGAKVLPAPWIVCPEYRLPTAEALGARLAKDLGRGAGGAWIVPDRATREGTDPEHAREAVGRGGVSLVTSADVRALFTDVDLRKTPIFFDAGSAALPLAALIAAGIGQDRLATLEGTFGADPFGALARDGALPVPLDRAFDEIRDLVEWSTRSAPRVRTLLVSTSCYHDAGANPVQELAYAVATGADYLRRLDMPVSITAPRVMFSFSVGGDAFMEIAKLRAARWLWAKIIRASGGDTAAQRTVLHARTSRWAASRLDPWVNAVRATQETFAAAVGGADAITVDALDAPIDDAATRFDRLALNTGLILREESHLGRVADPGGGSWYLEALTEELAREAWERFQHIERRGGMGHVILNGTIHNELQDVGVAKADAVARGATVVVGVNHFVHRDDELIGGEPVDHAAVADEVCRRLATHRAHHASAGLGHVKAAAEARGAAPGVRSTAAAEAADLGATVGGLAGALRAGVAPVHTSAIEPRPAAKAFEALNDAATAFAHRRGHRPEATLVLLDDSREAAARSTYAADLLVAAGFEVVRTSVHDDRLAERVRAEAYRVAVLCGADASYGDDACRTAQRLRTAGAIALAIAGYFGEHEQALRNAGVTHALHVGAHAVNTLRGFLDAAGATQ